MKNQPKKLTEAQLGSQAEAMIATVEKLFRKNQINDYDSLEAVKQGVRHYFTKPGANVETAIAGVLKILDKRMQKSGGYFDLGRFQEALRQGLAHQAKKQGVTEEDQLDELSPALTARYASKAYADKNHSDAFAKQAEQPSNKRAFQQRSQKRVTGITKALDKLSPATESVGDEGEADLSRYQVYANRPDLPYTVYLLPDTVARPGEPRFLRVDKKTGAQTKSQDKYFGKSVSLPPKGSVTEEVNQYQHIADEIGDIAGMEADELTNYVAYLIRKIKSMKRWVKDEMGGTYAEAEQEYSDHWSIETVSEYRQELAAARAALEGMTSGATPSLPEGIGSTIKKGVKKGVKSVKRGFQGWGSPYGGLAGDSRTGPKGIVARASEYDAAQLKQLKSSDPKATNGHSPAAFQQRVINRQLKQRQESVSESKVGTGVTVILSEGVKFRVSNPKVASILRRYRHEAENFNHGGELADDLFDALYDHYLNAGEMPYGVAKARDGDPYNWVSDKLDQEMSSGRQQEMTEDGGSSDNSDLDDVLERFPHEAKKFSNTGELDDNLYNALYDYYSQAGEMPYGVMKARDGDPYNWVSETLADYFEFDGGPDFDDENLEEADDAALAARKAKLAAQDAQWSKAKQSVENPFRGGGRGDSNDRGADLEWNAQATKPTAFRRGVFTDDVNEEILNEEPSEEQITAALSDVGLDEGLDFFFEGGLVVIGRSTARTVINALKSSGLGLPKISHMDGEEVRITFGERERPVADRHDVEQLAQQPEGDFEESIGGDDDEIIEPMVEVEDEENPYSTSINDYRRLSGMKEVEEVAEPEYSNAPDPSIVQSTNKMMSSGNDLNRSKKQYPAASNPAANPMAETRAMMKKADEANPMDETRSLMSAYDRMMKGVKK